MTLSGTTTEAALQHVKLLFFGSHVFLSSQPPTSILRRLYLRRIASFGLRVAIELPARQVIDAPLAGVRGEVSLDVVRRGTSPRVFGWYARAGLIGG